MTERQILAATRKLRTSEQSVEASENFVEFAEADGENERHRTNTHYLEFIMPERVDPLEAFNFTIEIDGIDVAGLVELSGLDSKLDVIEYRLGGDAQSRKLPGIVRYSNLILKTGITQDKSLYNWHMQWVKKDPAADRKQIRIVLRDGAGIEKQAWRVFRAWPVAYFGPTFNALTSRVAMQTFEIAHEGIELE